MCDIQMHKESQQTVREQETLEVCRHSLVVQLVQPKSLFVVRLCFGNHLVIGVEKVFCEPAKHVHDSQSTLRILTRSAHVYRSVEVQGAGLDSLCFVVAVVA